MFKKKALNQALSCKIGLLIPDEELEVSYSLTSTGQDIFDDLIRQIDLIDKDYFGLKFKDQIQWLDLTKSIAKQIKSNSSSTIAVTEPLQLEFRFKFYPADQALLHNEITRYYLYLQLRLDLIDGRLHSDSQETLAYLIACILQSELGDYVTDSKTEQKNYVAEFKFVPNQTEDLEWAAIELHKSEDFQGLSPSEAELNFLKKACQLDRYGIDPYPVKEGDSKNHFIIGVNHRGISTFQCFKKTHEFSWDEIERITFDGKLVLIYCRRVDKASAAKRKPFFGFRCSSKISAYNFWRIASEHRYFFTLDETPSQPVVTNTGGFFKKNHKLRYCGKVEKDVLKQSVDETRAGAGLRRSHSLLLRTEEGGRWHGFEAGNNLQTSLTNVNKTLPATLSYLREEDEDNELDESSGSLVNHSNNISCNSNINNFNFPTENYSAITNSNAIQQMKPFSRRSIVTTNQSAGNGDVKGSATTKNRQQEKKRSSSKISNNTLDLIKTNTIFFIISIVTILFIVLIVSDPSHQTLEKRLGFESVRRNIVQPASELFQGFIGQILDYVL